MLCGPTCCYISGKGYRLCTPSDRLVIMGKCISGRWGVQVMIIVHCVWCKATAEVYNDHVSSDMTKEEFRNVCKLAWEKPYGFVVVDLTSNKDDGKYRIGLDTFYIPN